MLELIGWFGGISLSLSALPQAVHTFKTKTTKGLSMSFIMLWLVGELFTIVYLVIHDFETQDYQLPLYLNYGLNLFIALYLAWFKLKEK